MQALTYATALHKIMQIPCLPESSVRAFIAAQGVPRHSVSLLFKTLCVPIFDHDV